jgi:hypothetical protein
MLSGIGILGTGLSWADVLMAYAHHVALYLQIDPMLMVMLVVLLLTVEPPNCLLVLFLLPAVVSSNH